MDFGKGHGKLISSADVPGVKVYLAVEDSIPIAQRDRRIQKAFEDALNTHRIMVAEENKSKQEAA